MLRKFKNELLKGLPLSTGFFNEWSLANVSTDGWEFKKTKSCELFLIGESRKGRPIGAFRVGHGPLQVSITAGAHSDEPVGPRTALQLAEGIALQKTPLFNELADKATWWIVPHVNPDGETINVEWMKNDPKNFANYSEHVFREPPGDDVEFCYPNFKSDRNYSFDPRPENTAVADFFRTTGKPFDLHFSLHSMAVANGAWYLICREWSDRWINSQVSQELLKFSGELGLSLHDWDRKGEKGFSGIAPGYSTTPRSDAMRDFFLNKDDSEMASRFRPSSMELIQSLGGDPLCLVSELPGWVIGKGEPGKPSGELDQFLEFAGRWREARNESSGMKIDQLLKDIPLKPVSFEIQSRLQFAFILTGLEIVS